MTPLPRSADPIIEASEPKEMSTMRRINAVIVVCAFALSACSSLENDLQKGFRYGSDSQRLIGKADAKRPAGQMPKGVNAYLWRAALDSVGFLPLDVADPDTGQIMTNWYSAPAEPGTRSKMLVEILDPDLRRDTIRVTVVRQQQDPGGDWTEIPAPAGTAQSLEDSIYTKARDLSPY
jgi:Domain of unknown function (DUF3576)